ncbi:hypothetical protein HY388_00915 [Candidatus Daviesbacteria bacterium]|nr:hypothetical protein [Candidatus Daviesbacteria bacterium]
MKKKSLYCLSIHSGHVAGAALSCDGKIVQCVSEERFNWQKNYLGYPRQSIDYVLTAAGITAADLDLVVLPSRYGAPIVSTQEVQAQMALILWLYRPINIIRQLWGILVYYLPPLSGIGRLLYRVMAYTLGRYTASKEKSVIAKHLHIPREKIIELEHHFSHAATAYLGSPLNKQTALVFTLDGEGDLLCSSVSVAEGGKICRIAATPREYSLGWMYYYVTKYFGMKPNEHEYKVMGLAPYAKDRDVQKVYDQIKDIIYLNPKNKLTFKAKFHMQNMEYFLRKKVFWARFDNLAGAIQKLLEDRVVEWIKEGIAATGISTVILSGGVFMNVKANQKIAELDEVKKIFIFPSCGDESLAIGACYVGYQRLIKQQGRQADICPISDLYLGPSYSNEEIERFLKKENYFAKYTIDKLEKIEERVAQLLAQGQVVGRLSGRMEWGARALGNRSLLANPQDPDVVMVLNEQMKDRDFWMPFTPSVLDRCARNYIKNPKKISAPYMIMTFDTTKLGKKDLKAAIHPYDFTCRPQVLEKSWNVKYYSLIEAFEKLTGIGAVLNTSFNLHGLPIVLGPREAMYVFENSGLEFLAMENFLVRKSSPTHAE